MDLPVKVLEKVVVNLLKDNQSHGPLCHGSVFCCQQAEESGQGGAGAGLCVSNLLSPLEAPYPQDIFYVYFCICKRSSEKTMD